VLLTFTVENSRWKNHKWKSSNSDEFKSLMFSQTKAKKTQKIFSKTFINTISTSMFHPASMPALFVWMKSSQSLFSDALFILTSTPKQRFEFIFTDYGTNPTHFAPVFEIYKIYQSTSLYRELKLRGAILTDGQLGILPQEQVYKQLSGVYNLSSDQGNLGVFIITNVRLVWFADANSNFNISLPFMQIISLRLRESKYGLALVIQTAQTAGNYVLGFRVDPASRLQEVYKEISSLHTVYSQSPIFGVNYDLKATVNLRFINAVALPLKFALKIAGERRTSFED
jgi:Bardet-Biedl syndrome 5 protein